MKAILMRSVLMLLVAVMAVVATGGCKTTASYQKNDGYWDTDLNGNRICVPGGNDCSTGATSAKATFES